MREYYNEEENVESMEWRRSVVSGVVCSGVAGREGEGMVTWRDPDQRVNITIDTSRGACH